MIPTCPVVPAVALVVPEALAVLVVLAALVVLVVLAALAVLVVLVVLAAPEVLVVLAVLVVLVAPAQHLLVCPLCLSPARPTTRSRQTSRTAP
jgi:hypothetical protein